MLMRPSLSQDTQRPARGAQAVICPLCTAQSLFWKSLTPEIDSCGFESYSLQCNGCGAQLVGIVDPADDVLLLTALAS
jgi:hypothetical protein